MTACAVDEPPTITPLQSGLSSIELLDTQATTNEVVVDESANDQDLCALAAALPADDLCSLVCDPEALRQGMLDAGAPAGKCYLLLCQMSETVHTTVGVCLL